MMVFAQISDIHLDGGRHRFDRAAAVVSYLNGLRAPLAAVLVTGDIADHGLPAEYQQARDLLATSPHPVFCCPGNHDQRPAFREGLLDHPASDTPINQAHRTEHALFALCDSTIPGRSDGKLADETIAWLDGVLAEDPDLPAFVCCHHPPLGLRSPFIDDIRQTGEQRLADLLARHPQVVAILCGHAHTPAATTFAGRPLLVSPGVASTLVLPWEQGDLLTDAVPPGLAFHVLDDERRLTTHYRVVA
ncbi:MAG TPA: metallophosphoesterase [Pseudonocardiaceae bacterium]|jgi:3',5'-cyclic AMP phosphodiesterase CpdA|nr:metallophosphoesterase [Pseudonocardiaceae bacterium]